MGLSVVDLEPILPGNNCVQLTLTHICESRQCLQNVTFTDLLHANGKL